MRATHGLLGGIVFLLVGFMAVTYSASAVESQAVGNQPSGEAFNATEGVFSGIGQAAGPAIVWMGVGAFVLIALGFLVYAGQSGR